MGRGHYIHGRWIQGGGAEMTSLDPSTGRVIWSGPGAGKREMDEAVHAAGLALEPWAALPLEERIRFLEAFASAAAEERAELAETISLETGKPRWESLEEVNAVIGKVALSVRAFQERRSPVRIDISGIKGAVHYRPVGVLAVLGPFNMPGHIPNGHIVPALLSGNTVVYKPSRFVPLFSEKYIALWEASGIPAGVINLVQCGREAGARLVDHPDVDGLLFTGSYETGRKLHEAFAGRPEKILALEMGGNNPLVVSGVSDPDAAVVLTILSAFITAGQRCTCARRLIVERGGEGDGFIERLRAAMRGIRTGPYGESPEPFYGPVISKEAADRLMTLQEGLIRDGAKPVVRMEPDTSAHALLRPGLLDVTEVEGRPDSEWFGPLLQVIRVPDFDAALEEAKETSYGLAAGLLSDSRSLWEKFSSRVRAGHMVWNRQTTGASGRLPFGGLGRSGNHRPSGYFAVDYCSDPVACLEMENMKAPAALPPGLENI
ncbi:MAG: succinylglutamate-semialdehyde dehydrogenase [Pseudomonadota bacterium]